MSPRSFTKLLEKAVYNDYNRYSLGGLEMEEVSKAKHYIAVNAGGRYPLLKTAQDYTEYFHEALSFSDLYETYRYIEKHGLEKIATVITRMI